MTAPHKFVMGDQDISKCAECGEGVNTDVHDETGASSNGAAAPEPAKKRGRPRAAKNQRTIDDLVIEDPELEDALALVSELEPQARAFREARHTVKTRIQTEHEDVINALTDDGRPRWAVVGNHRLLYKTATRPAAKKAAPAGVSTKLDIQVLAE